MVENSKKYDNKFYDNYSSGNKIFKNILPFFITAIYI